MHVERNVISIQPKQTRLIRAPFLGTATSTQPNDVPTDKETTTSRFVEPYQFGSEQRAAIRELLDDLQVSDDEGRRVFLLALEYEIGTFQQVVMEHLEPIEETAPTDQRLDELGNAARQLAQLLDAAGEETKANILQGMRDADIFNRISDECYLRSLQCEIDRLASACERGIETGQKQQGPLNESSRRFVGMLANIYSECFEATATPGEDEPFHHILQAIVEQTGLQVRFDAGFLAKTLAQAE